jgi:hypothetical protein
MHTYYPRHVNGHVEYYNEFGQFVVSGDTVAEAENNLIEIITERAQLKHGENVA